MGYIVHSYSGKDEHIAKEYSKSKSELINTVQFFSLHIFITFQENKVCKDYYD